MRVRFVPRISAAAAVALLAGAASAQTAPIAQFTRQVAMDSGVVVNNNAAPQVVFVTTVTSAGDPWLRLTFDSAVLAGRPGIDGSYLKITSAQDGAVQILNGQGIRDWNYTSAYFNGDSVIVELIAYPGTGENHVAMSELWAGDPNFVLIDPESICGPTDDRTLSSDKRNARLLPVGCSAWLFNDAAKCFGTAGHCISTGTSNAVVQFNVPLSSASGQVVNPPPQDQYPVDQPSIQTTGSLGAGNDAAYFGTKVNSNTGKTAFEAQGDAYILDPVSPAVTAGAQIRITGYGTVSAPVSPTWNQVQKTHVGPYFSKTVSGAVFRLQYQTDTTGGNSGSPVIYEPTGHVIGVHGHAGCSTTAGNSGTASEHVAWTNFRNNPKGVCIPPACYPDCDNNATLDFFDFLCFQNAFSASQSYADCDNNSVFDFFDFLCFQNAFAAGCP